MTRTVSQLGISYQIIDGHVHQGGASLGTPEEGLPGRKKASPSLSGTPNQCVVAGAGFAECYTKPETYWIDL